MPRAKLVDSKPRGRVSAYAFFIQNCREDHKKEHPDENVVFAEFSRKCAERWRSMDEKEKQRFHELAQKDKTRYDSEMQGYTGPKTTRTRKRRQRKDPNAPKRALSGFFWFSSDERPKIKIAFPEYGAADTAKELGHRWSRVDSECKERYEQMAIKDRARYEKEMEQYKLGNSFGAKKPKIEHIPEGASDDDMDDDDDDDASDDDVE